MKPAGVGIIFQREETLDHQGLVVRTTRPRHSCPRAIGNVFRFSARPSDARLRMTLLCTAMPLRQVDSLAPGGPADLSKNVQPGDRLIEINGKSIKGLDARSGHDPYAPCRPTRSATLAYLCFLLSDFRLLLLQKKLPCLKGRELV